VSVEAIDARIGQRMDRLPVSVERSSRLAAPADRVWAGAVTEEGINDELRPLLRMTMPPGLRGQTIDTVEVGTPLGRSWLLLGGLLPVDYDDLCLVELEPGRRFLERSKLASLRDWQHERIVEAAGADACVVTDRLGFVPRIPGTRAVAVRIVGALFAHRHRRMTRRYGAAD
jgi:hypothetical protein